MKYFKNSTSPARYRYMGAISAFACCLMLASTAIAATSSGQQVFPSAAAAAKALVGAARIDDMAALSSILGGDAKEVLSSGDPVADNNARDNFVAKYDQMQRLAYDDRGRVILYLGADNWPFPIPLVKSGDGWVFDTEAGKRELLFRRVGRNELYTIDVLADLADAQEEYASEIRDNASVKQFAQKIQSEPGKHDGLYWTVSSGEEESPIGPLIADATAEGYKTGAGGHSVSRLLLQNPLSPGKECSRRCERLSRRWKNDARFCLPCLSGHIPRVRRHDIYDKSGRRYRSKGPWPEHG